MTEATGLRLNTQFSEISPKIHYLVGMSQPETHLFEVTLHIVNYPLAVLDLKMPVWTPGSYLVREYGRHLQDFAAFADHQPLSWYKFSKNHLQVAKNNVSQVCDLQLLIIWKEFQLIGQLFQKNIVS
jgi:hypothetical protein